jgi:hypothetical protein
MLQSSSLRVFHLIDDVLKRSLTNESPQVDVPAGSLKVTLRSHQQAAIAAMEHTERELSKGMDCSGEIFYSPYAILGDSVGVGKSLMVLSHIARISTITPIYQRTTMGANSTLSTFSIKNTAFTDISEAGCLIIVPHTLFRQWADYIKKQTNLRHVLLDKKKAYTHENFTTEIMGAEVVLVSNTQYKEFSMWQKERNITWKRAFIDESDTIHIVNGYPRPEARFTWFITASWMNMMFPNETIYMQQQALHTHVFSDSAPFFHLKPYFQDIYNINRPYSYMRYSMTSYNFLRDVFNNSHRLRSRLVVRCDDSYVQQSISLPLLYRSNVICRAPLNQRIVSQVVPTEVQQLLHGGDVTGAIAALGVKTEEVTSIVEAVTKNLQKELARHKATYEFKSAMEYSTTQAKEAALKSLEEKMQRTEDSIRSIQERIEGFRNDACPICFDEPQEPLITPCCSRVFCGQCILTCVTRKAICPMCRANIVISKLTKVVDSIDTTQIVTTSESSASAEEVTEKKPDALLRLFRENPTGRFLVFSRYDNPFTAIEEAITTLGVRVKQLKGNKDAIAATLRAFQGGDLRCLLLNSHYAGSGLNITAATHVVLLHAMTHEEEKQILGRAYRMGRTEPLHFIRLLHADELTTTS